MRLRIHRTPGRRRDRPWFHTQSFGAGRYWHRYWFAGRLMVYLMTARP